MMSWLQRLFSRKRLDAQLDQELRFHLDQLTEDLVRQGLDPADARRQAALRFGGSTQVAEDCRDARGTAMMESLLQDVKYAVRVLFKNPAPTATAVVAVGLAIGANTLIFSGVHALLLKPLPYPDQDRLFMLSGAIPGESGIGFSSRELELWMGAQKSFEAFGGFVGNGFTLTGHGEPLALFGLQATPEVFTALNVPAALGRVIDASDARAGRDHVVVLSDGLWRERFGGDPSVIGQSVYLNRESYTVIGVMPREFAFPAPRTKLWIPATLNTGLFQKFPDAHFLRTIGRLRAGVSEARLWAEIDILGKRLAESDPSSGRIVNARPLTEVARGPVRRPLAALTAAVAFVLLIACANVASLLLARGAARYREFAVRVALGAARFRLVQQLVVESMLLALAGGSLGIGIAVAGIRILRAAGPAGLPGIEMVEVDLTVLVFGVAVSLVTGLIFGCAPAMLAARRALVEGLRQGARSTGDRAANRLQRILVAVEVALSVILAAGAGVFAHSFVRLSSQNPGFRPDHVLTASVVMDERSYPDERKMLRWSRNVIDLARAMPGVDAAAIATHMPFSGQGWGNSYDVEGRPAEPGKGYVAQIRPVSPDFFRALGIPLRQGQTFTERDLAGAVPAVIVNENLARRFWPNDDAVGRRIRYDQEWATIRGVVADIKHARLDSETDPEIYVPYEQLSPRLLKFLGRGVYVVVHGSLDAAGMASALRGCLRTADPAMAIRELRPMERLISDSFAQSKLRTLLLASFSGIALLLAAIGIYGVMSNLVAQRTHEIGVRMAMGASRTAVVWMVVSRALAVTAVGVFAGLLGAAALVRTVRGLLFGVSEYDPLAFTLAPGLIVAAAVFASMAPALRAARTDPLISLRLD